MSGLFGELPEQADPNPLGRGAARLRVPVREGVQLVMIDFDGLISLDHPARAIWSYAVQVDFSDIEARVRSREGRPGMPQTAPHLLLALWLYALSDGVGSAREMARLCERDPAYRWLCGGVGVNHHLLSDFRMTEGGRIEALLAAHVASLSVAGLIDLDTIAQDGVKVRANAGAASFRRRKTLEEEHVKAQALVAKLAEEEKAKPGSAGRRRRTCAARAAADRASRVEAALKTMQELEAKRVEQEKRDKKQAGRRTEPRASTTDHEARVMKMADGGFRPGYNVQFASLPENGVIVAVTTTNAATDKGLLEPMAQKLAKIYGRRPRQHLVDGGYQVAADIEAAHAAGTTVFSPPQKAKSGVDPHIPKPDDGVGVSAWRERMATEPAKAIYSHRSRCELVHARLRNISIDRLRVRGCAKVQSWMAGFALAMNILTEQRLRRPKSA